METERAVVVGGGIVGTMHALEACRRGWEVVHLESDVEPRRASVRNFGLVWVSGRAAGEELDLAERARQLWDRVAQDAPGVSLRPIGSVTLARHPTEWDVLCEAAGTADAARRGFELLDAADVRRVNPALRGDFVGGLRSTADAVVEPRGVLPALRQALEATGRYRWRPGTTAVDVQSGSAAGSGPVVIDSNGDRHPGSTAILCIGDRTTGMAGRVGTAIAGAPLTKCRLHMIQTAPAAETVTTAVGDGDTLRYYPAFDLPSRLGLPSPSRTTDQWCMQLLLVQREDGGLTIGDTHSYDEPFDFSVDEAVAAELARRAEELLGWSLPPLERRWTGVYTLTTMDDLFLRRQVESGVWLVTGLAGRGMTMSPAVAEQTWEAISP